MKKKKCETCNRYDFIDDNYGKCRCDGERVHKTDSCALHAPINAQKSENKIKQKSCEDCKYFKKWDDQEFPYCEYVNLRLFELTTCGNFEEDVMNKFEKNLQMLADQKSCGNCVHFHERRDQGDVLCIFHNRLTSRNYYCLDFTPINTRKNEMSTKDPVNPSYYRNGKVSCIDAMESATVNKKGAEAVFVAMVIKYLWRYEEKNGLEDVKKAQWYLNRLLKVLENNED